MMVGVAARRLFLALMGAMLGLMALPQAGFAQGQQQPGGVAELPAAAPEVAGQAEAAVAAPPAFEHYGADMIRGQPVPAEDSLLGSMGFQSQFSDNGHYALWMHDYILMPIITAISLLVLGLLLWVMLRYNRRRNPVASRTSHNTLIEVIWTVVPVIILVVIAVPSITLLARQYESAPEDALTVKVTGYQWYWGYSYPDNGGFEVIANMMPQGEALAAGLPPQLETDNRMVVPVGEPIRIQITGADVIHSFGIPSLWFKLDAVPGRINEKMLMINEPGIYYGQCMELCGARHGYMPIAIEARPRAEFEAWVRSRGGTVGGEAQAPAAAAAPADAGAAA